ncbi:tRNA pseudouridine(55) synthase TruB [Flavobacteriaceae bacterium Ap0902]|nr:tRNA pseudouridine(55) synthase TruB [Flavobacteriaceae bacterium Ap0902]
MTLEKLREGKIFVIDKPLDWTSFDVVNKIRWNIRKTFKVRKFKVGHAGTLDPKATGVLVICVGKFTKKINELQYDDKIYTGTFKLGATTESFDTEKPENEFFPTNHLTEDLIHQTIKQFMGEINQFPPIHSAIKQDGKRLYEMARAGEEIQLTARRVTIHEFEITRIELPFVDFRVKCSKGTYIRSLANDFGKALGSGGYLTSLRRTHSGEFSIEMADNSPLDQSYFLGD